MIRFPLLLAVSSVALAASAQAAPAVRDFQLPPSNPTPTPSPNVQGPVDTEGPVPVRPRAIPTVTPTPTSAPTQGQATVTTPQPLATPSPRLTLPPRTAASPAPRAATPTTTQPAAPAAADLAPATDLAPTASTTLPTLPPSAAPVLPSAAPSVAEPDSGFLLWPWLLALVVALGAGAVLYFRRGGEARYAEAPQIELPPVAPRAQPQPAPTPPVAPKPPAPPLPAPAPSGPASPLALDAVPVQLSRSMMNATFAYRLTLANRGDTPLEDIAIGADLVTAHASIPMEQQVSRGDTPLPEMGRIGAIAPGEKVEVSGELRLPLSAIRTVTQGKAQLYVPLLRVRASAPGMEASARTFVVGMLPQEGGRKLQPFRLDEMPQTYRAIGTMALG